jgi:hypothetical protein
MKKHTNPEETPVQTAAPLIRIGPRTKISDPDTEAQAIRLQQQRDLVQNLEAELRADRAALNAPGVAAAGAAASDLRLRITQHSARLSDARAMVGHLETELASRGYTLAANYRRVS